jgi:excisionase family DNA binding protein
MIRARDMQEFLTLNEVCELFRVSPDTVQRMIKRKEIPAFKVGNQWRFKRDYLLRIIEQGAELLER